MPTCDVCDGDSFYDQDGKFYCNNCGIESQDMDIQMTQELDKETFSQLDTKKLKLTAKRKGERKRLPFTVGKPWVIYEGIQCMIKAHADCLIKMGFDPKLKDIVCQLWFGYLQHINLAFCEEESPTISLQSKEMGRNRNVGIMPGYYKKILLGKHKYNPEEDLDDEEFEENVKQEDFFEDDMPDIFKENEERKEDSGSSSNSEGEDVKNIDAESIGSFQIIDDQKKARTKLKQRHILAFCYIGLVLLEEPVLLSDLVRWSNEGFLPYHKANQVLPPELKFSSSDHHSLCKQHNIKLSKISQIARALVKELKIDMCVTKEINQIILASLIIDLQLPDVVYTLACILLDTVKFPFKYPLGATNHFGQLYCFDGHLAAYVVIAVKMIYGLDGTHEMRNEKNTKLLNQLQSQPVISWKKWVEKNHRKYKSKIKNGIPRTVDDLNYMLDSSTYMDFLTKEMFSNFDIRTSTRTFRVEEGLWQKALQKSSKEKYYKLFETSAEELNSGKNISNITRHATSFPLSIDHHGNLINIPEKRTAEIGKWEIICKSDLSEFNDRKTVVNEVSENILDQNTVKLEDLDVKEKDEIIEETDKCFGYLNYTRCLNYDDYHDSYKYILRTVAHRVEMESIQLQRYVHYSEGKMFNEEFSERYQDWLKWYR